MSPPVCYWWDKASEEQVRKHLINCDTNFVPSLSSRVEIDMYAKKIVRYASRAEAWCDDKLIGMVAFYCSNQQDFVVYITSVSIERNWSGRGIALSLLQKCAEHAKSKGMKKITLEVANNNNAAVSLYKKMGFVDSARHANNTEMVLLLDDKEKYE